MVGIIDEDGRLFGLVNVVDLLVVLVVVAMAAAGFALVTGSLGEEQQDTTTTTTTTVTFEAQQVEPYVATAIPNGSVDGPEVVAVHSKRVAPATVVVPDQNGQLRVRQHPRLKSVTLQLELNTTQTPNGLFYTDERQTGNGPVLRKGPVLIGEQVRLGIGDVTVTGNITAIDG